MGGSGSGGYRAGSGRKPASLSMLKLSGGVRADKHAHLILASKAATAPALAPNTPAIPTWLLEGLAEAGVRFVTDAFATFTWQPVELSLLRACGRACDDMETAVDARSRAVSARLLASLVAQLHLQSEESTS
jgi:hypothetical protein